MCHLIFNEEKSPVGAEFVGQGWSPWRSDNTNRGFGMHFCIVLKLDLTPFNLHGIDE